MPLPVTLERGLFFIFLLALTLFLLIWLNRQLNQRLYRFLLLCTGSDRIAMLGLFLLFLPGIILHECTHWLAALVLGMKPYALSLWPVKQGNRIELGSVRMQGADIWRETLVGLAPLFAGSALIATVGARVFRAQDLVVYLLRLQPARVLELIRTILAVPDSILWLYLIFATGNSMLPSASDRRSLSLVLYYLGIGVLLFTATDLMSDEVNSRWGIVLIARLTFPLQTLNSFLFLVILVNLFLLSLLVLYAFLISTGRTRHTGSGPRGQS